MTDYLGHLVTRTLNPAQPVQPRLLAQFEPLPSGSAAGPGAALVSERADEAAVALAGSAEPALQRAVSAARLDGTAFPERSRQEVPLASPPLSARPVTPVPSREEEHPAPHSPSLRNRLVVQSPSLSGPPAEDSSMALHAAPTWQEARDVPSPALTQLAGDPGLPLRQPVRARALLVPAQAAALVPAAQGTPPAQAQPRVESPVVHVTIGRVEVRAVMPPTAPVARPGQPPGPRLSLEEYLKRRSEGQR